MKKYKLFSIIIILFTLILTFFTFTNPSKINAEETKLTLSSKACYLIEEKSGHVIYKENEEAKKANETKSIELKSLAALNAMKYLEMNSEAKDKEVVEHFLEELNKEDTPKEQPKVLEG